MTLDHLRVSWNKSTTPYLAFVAKLLRPRFMRYQPRAIRIPRPSGSSYTEPVHGWLYFDGPLSALNRQKRIVLNIPGGGFVAMDPRTNDDSLFAWAGRTGLPILSLDYRKAPEYPYPYALNESYDVYHTIIATRGRCLGLSGETVPQIVLSGDSAGGNLATGTVLMVIQSSSTDTRLEQSPNALPRPAGLVLSYPALDVNIGNWMTDEQMSLIRDRGMRKTVKRVLRRKNSTFDALTPGASPHVSDDEEASPPSTTGPPVGGQVGKEVQDLGDSPSAPNPLSKTRLATPSMISYVNDRVLTPEMMRAMIILYVGPHSRPDFSTEYLLSPVLAPEQLLARFPKTYIITGERDPLVDDTVIMAGRIRAAKRARWNERRELGALTKREKKRGWHESDCVEVCLIEGISHAFIQIAQLYPQAWKYIHKMGGWYIDAFNSVDAEREAQAQDQDSTSTSVLKEKQRRMESQKSRNQLNTSNSQHHRRTPTASSMEEDNPLEIGSARKKAAHYQSAHSGLDQQEHGSGILGLDSHSDQVGSPRSPATPAGGLARDHPLHRPKSVGDLASEEDLLARRMRGLVGGLTRRERRSSEEDA
ncbi:MAG: hypothetical protein M1831_003717 [Alyxoria varia]|nr:MAG: hypothetical protein M1831_003717 [Alyxoria varia]